MGIKKFLVILAVVTILIVILVAWFVPVDEDFRLENPYWNGLKDLIVNYPIEPLESFADLPSPPWDTTLILVPYLELTESELGQLDSYIREGGRLILADDYGHGNQILDFLSLEVRFSGEVLVDPLVNYKTGYFPEIIHLESDQLTKNMESLVLNHATCIINTDDDSVIALSSSFSFLDLNANETYEDNEISGPFPVIYREVFGEGQVVLLADPSLFINSMTEIGENDKFIQNIVETTTALYIDQSHLPPSDLRQTKILLAQGRDYLTNPLMTAGLVALVVVITLQPIWQRKKKKQIDV